MASSSSKAKSLAQRQETVFKKAYQLSILCGVEVCVICYGSDGELKTWPQDIDKVKDMARRYSELSEMKRRKKSVNLHKFLEKINNNDSDKKKKKKKKKKKARVGSGFKYPDWDPRFNTYSLEQLMEVVQSLEHNLARIQHRLHVVVESQKQNTNMAYQKQRMSNLQQHANDVSMYLYNYEIGTLSQIPETSTLGFDQAQSLPPLPNSLTIYQNPNVENYLGFLGMQETGIDGFQNMNMLTYGNNNNNSVNDF